MKADNIEETIYDVIIIGGGIAGLTAAYMLRDKNILIIEKEDRLGGRVLSEKVNEATNNIGTQFFSEGDSSFADLLNELNIKRHTLDINRSPIALYLDDKFYPDAKSYITIKFILQSIKMMFMSYRKYLVSKQSYDSPGWKKLAAQNTEDLQKGMGKEVLSLMNTFMRGTSLTKPKRTSGIMGAGFMGGVAEAGEISFIDGGFQKITDAMASRLEDKFIYKSQVDRVEENGEIIYVSYRQNGKEFVIKSKSVVVSVPAPEALKFLPNITKNRKRALEMIKYGPLTMVSVYLKRTIPWKRFFSLLSDSAIFQGIIDQTLGTEEDDNYDNPILYNFIITQYPDETEVIQKFLNKSDDEIIALTLNDFKKMIPEASLIEDYITGSKVTRFPIGELELSPEYYLESLPYLQKPEGNIHFCGDYTEAESFVDGAVNSGFRVARELGSKYVVSEKDEKKTPKIPRWGKWGMLTMSLNLLLVVLGFLIPGVAGTVMSIGAILGFLTTLLLPTFFPPFKQIYKLLLVLSGIYGTVIGLIIRLVN